MHEHINTPPTLVGDEKNQLQQLWSYLYGMSEAINRNLQAIGGNDLTDRERAAVQGIIQTGGGLEDVQSLRDMVVRLAEYVKKTVNEIKSNPLESEMDNGRLTRYVQIAEMEVPADLSGNNKKDPLITILRKLKGDDLGLRNGIFVGELRTGVTGAAIGPDVVTYAADGTESLHTENAVLEITGGGIRFLENGDELMKISSVVSGSTQTVKIEPGADAEELKVYAELIGAVQNAETTETDFDDITEAGSYWVDVSGMTNGPTGLSTGDCLLEVNAGAAVIRQKLEAEAAIYIRRCVSNTWGGWVEYTGTAQ